MSPCSRSGFMALSSMVLIRFAIFLSLRLSLSAINPYFRLPWLSHFSYQIFSIHRFRLLPFPSKISRSNLSQTVVNNSLSHWSCMIRSPVHEVLWRFGMVLLWYNQKKQPPTIPSFLPFFYSLFIQKKILLFTDLSLLLLFRYLWPYLRD